MAAPAGEAGAGTACVPRSSRTDTLKPPTSSPAGQDNERAGAGRRFAHLYDLEMTDTLARDTRTVASIVGGRPETDAPGGRLVSTNPADSSDVVAEALLGDAATFVAACRAARAAQHGWAAVPAPVRGRAIQQIGRLVEDNKEALARLVTREIGKPYAESLGEVQEIVDTCDFFVVRGPPAVRADGAVGDARQAAVHVPQAGGRGGDHHRRQLPGRRAVLVPRAGAAVRQRGRLEAGRVRAGARRGAGGAVPARRAAGRAC